MTDPGGGWTSPGSDTPGGPPADGSWQPPTYPPQYPQQYPQHGQPPAAAPPPPAPYQGWAPAWSPMPGVVPLRPLGVGELLDGAVKVIRRYPRPTLALSALVSLVVTVINVLLLVAVDPTQTLDTSTGESTSFGSGFSSNVNAASLPGNLLDFLGGAILTGALVTVVSRAVLGRSASLGDAWEAIRPRLWALLGVAFLRVLLTLAPIVLVVVLALVAGPLALLLILPLIPLEIWLWTVLSVSAAALVLERAGVVTALKRSRVLVQRDFWRSFGVLALGSLITTVLSSILVVPVALVAELPLFTGGTATLGTGFFVVSALVSGLAQTLVAPYSAGLRALLYVDLRMRTEGLDVALQTAAATTA